MGTELSSTSAATIREANIVDYGPEPHGMGEIAAPYEPSPAEVHVACLRMGAWGPRCAPLLWTVPLIHPDHWEFATCLRCRREVAPDDAAH